MNFIIPIIPKAQARARAGINKATGRAIMYTSSKQRNDQKDLIALMAPYRPEGPSTHGIYLWIDVYLPIPKSWSKIKRANAESGIFQPKTKPDIDNLAKQVMDCMTKLCFWHDDSQVVELRITKRYSNRPRWEIDIRGS